MNDRKRKTAGLRTPAQGGGSATVTAPCPTACAEGAGSDKTAPAVAGAKGRTLPEAGAREAGLAEAVSPETVPPEAEMNLGICPYYMRDRGKGIVYCECAKFRFPDNGSRREILYRYCAHPEGYKACMIKLALDHYYERKYACYEEESS